MVSLKPQRGAILIIVMIFSTVMSMLTLLSMENTWFESKMTQAFSHSIERRIEQEQTMFSLEKMFHNNPDEFIKSGQARLLQFVPDTIHFGDRSGLYYYELQIGHIVTTQIIHVDDVGNDKSLGLSNAMEISFSVPSKTTTLLETDRFSKGWVDAVYAGDDSGNIWRLNTDPFQHDEWRWHKLKQVEGRVIGLFATSISAFELPILIVRSTNLKDECDQIYGLVGSDMIWSQTISKSASIKLHRYWLEVGERRIDVTSGRIAMMPNGVRIQRLNWREIIQ